MTSERMAAVEQLLCERYNVRALDGPLKEAIDADDVVRLRELLEQRELYQWRGAILAALPDDATEEQAEGSDDKSSEKPIAEMTRAELMVLAAGLGVEISGNATKAELVEALTPPE